MKKIILIGFALSGILLAGESAGEKLYAKCVGCHGKNGEKSALGKSALIQGQDKELTIKQIKGYKEGTLNKHGMGSLMRTQVQNLSDKEIEEVAEHISNFK